MHLFPRTKLSPADRTRLAPFSGNDHGTRAFLRTEPSREDVQRLLAIELERGYKVRHCIIDRLVGRLAAMDKEDLHKRIAEYLSPKKR